QSTTETDTRSLHDALPIYRTHHGDGVTQPTDSNLLDTSGSSASASRPPGRPAAGRAAVGAPRAAGASVGGLATPAAGRDIPRSRSEEHTSELQSRSDLVCR